jgi:hypothetical protein
MTIENICGLEDEVRDSEAVFKEEMKILLGDVQREEDNDNN